MAHFFAPASLTADHGWVVMTTTRTTSLVAALTATGMLVLATGPATAAAGGPPLPSRSVDTLAAGFQIHLRKPVDPSDIIAAVASLGARADR